MSSKAEKRQLVVKLISQGKLDQELELISEAIRRRQDTLNFNKLALFSEGDEVRFNTKVKPRYLRGFTGKVLRVEGEKVWIDVGTRIRKYGPHIGCPASIIDAVEDDG